MPPITLLNDLPNLEYCDLHAIGKDAMQVCKKAGGRIVARYAHLSKDGSRIQQIPVADYRFEGLPARAIGLALLEPATQEKAIAS